MTELSSCCSEDVEWDAPCLYPMKPPAHVLQTITNIPETSNVASSAATMASEVDLQSLCSTTVSPNDHPPKEGSANAQAPKKKPRRRQKKKKKIPLDGEVAVKPVEHKHQKERMEKFKKMKATEKSKKTRMESARSIKVLNGVTPVPFELGQFRPSLKVGREPRVYRHEELKALGVRTIPWDGQ